MAEKLKTLGALSGACSFAYLLLKEGMETEAMRKKRLEWDMKKVQSPFKLKNEKLHFVEKQSVKEALTQGFADKDGGVQVLYAPPGSGKTSYLKNAIASQSRPTLLISKLSSAEDFYALLHMKRNELVSDFVPDKSLIVIDQLEQTQLTDELCSMILHLATDSRGAGGKYNVVLCFSKVDAANKVLLLNGMDKIFPMFDRSVFHWGKEEIGEFCKNTCVGWKPEQIKCLERLAITAKCPGFLQHVLHIFPEGIPIDDEKEMKDLEAKAVNFDKNWINSPLPGEFK